MRNLLLLALIVLSPFVINAQSNVSCDFEKLFSVKPGMDMPSAIAQLHANTKITMLKQSSEKLKPYKGEGDSILHQVVTYRIDSSNCIKGNKPSITFEFADGKLYKAFIESSYSSSGFGDMMTDFNFLHKQILKKYKYEKQLTLSGTNTEGVGYTFFKTQDKNAKLDICLLQYVKASGSTPSNDKYTLEIIWINLKNTRMEKSSF